MRERPYRVLVPSPSDETREQYAQIERIVTDHGYRAEVIELPRRETLRGGFYSWNYGDTCILAGWAGTAQILQAEWRMVRHPDLGNIKKPMILIDTTKLMAFALNLAFDGSKIIMLDAPVAA